MTQKEQLELLRAENEALLAENKAVLLSQEEYKTLIGKVLEDARITENVRREYTATYIAITDK